MTKPRTPWSGRHTDHSDDHAAIRLHEQRRTVLIDHDPVRAEALVHRM
ncbi:hypothetical protein [Streptomyces sp. NPDC096311]